jgi:hypothetical protein
MTMIPRTLVLALLAAISFSASADFRTVQRAYEVALIDFRAPVSQNGTLTFRPCSSCEERSIRVNAATRYELNSERVELQEFRNRILRVPDRAKEPVIVLHDLESDTVAAVSITL